MKFQLGESLGREIFDAFEYGFNEKNFYVVAFSAGVQLSGYAGRTLISESNKKKRLERFLKWFCSGSHFFCK